MILLDTCTLLWLVGFQEKLPREVKETLRQNVGKLYVSAISAFEIGIKVKKSLLKLPLPPEKWFDQALQHHGLQLLPIDSDILFQTVALPDIHRGPADRIIVATAQAFGLKILTPDSHIAAYPETQTVWQ